jgi:hypothetical protein
MALFALPVPRLAAKTHACHKSQRVRKRQIYGTRSTGDRNRDALFPREIMVEVLEVSRNDANGLKHGKVMQPAHVYQVRPRKDHRGVDLISDALPFGRLCYGEPNAISNALGYAKFYSRSHHAVIRVCAHAGNVIETQEQAGEFKEC